MAQCVHGNVMLGILKRGRDWRGQDIKDLQAILYHIHGTHLKMLQAYALLGTKQASMTTVLMWKLSTLEN